ncbi:MAG: alpha/beta family hydrolase [Pyrinomonadaceae bacterium]
MSDEASELKFLSTSEKGEVSALLLRPSRASHLLVLGHGAGADMRHASMQAIAESAADASIATFRYNFPFMEQGRAQVDAKDTCTATIRAAVGTARAMAPDLPLLAGGHSFGGRMTSTAAAESPLPAVKGIVLFSFPLHPPDRPDTKRAEHLSAVTVPLLFLSGTRDKLAHLDLLEPVVEKLGSRATLHLLDTADHSYKILKRTRKSHESVFDEMAGVLSVWAASFP